MAMRWIVGGGMERSAAIVDIDATPRLATASRTAMTLAEGESRAADRRTERSFSLRAVIRLRSADRPRRANSTHGNRCPWESRPRLAEWRFPNGRPRP